MSRLFALDRAHRLCERVLCCLWLTVLLTSLPATVVQSAPANVQISNITELPIKLDIYNVDDVLTSNNVTIVHSKTTPLPSSTASPVSSTPSTTTAAVSTAPSSTATAATTTTTTEITPQKSYPKRNLNDSDVRSVVVKHSPSHPDVPNNNINASQSTELLDDLLDYRPQSGPYLLMCSVKAIRYWSPKCALHSSNELLSHRPSMTNLRNGFSGLSVRQNTAGNWTELVWFDVEKYEFHLARFALRSNATQCDNPLTFAYNTTLDYVSNPNAFDYKLQEEKMVKIASSSRHLMVANYLLDRIDVYYFNDAEMKLHFVESISVTRPSDIVFQRNHLLWLENGQRICRIRNMFNQLRSAEPECHETKNETILAFTVLKNKQILYATKVHGHIYSLDWNSFESQFLGSIDLPEIVSMTSLNSDLIFFSENDGQVHRLNISNGFHDLEAVSIEATTIFDIHFMNNDFEEQSESNYLEDDYREIVHVASSPNKLLFIGLFVGCLILLIYALFVIVHRRPNVRQHLSNIQAKLPNARGLLRNIRPYAQMRQTRSTSMSNALIEDDDDSLANFRHNISTHRPVPANDIEDLLRNGTVPQSSVRCMTCRDPGICQDKGFCMATYRSQ